MSYHTVQTTVPGRKFGMVKALEGFSMTVPRW